MNSYNESQNKKLRVKKTILWSEELNKTDFENIRDQFKKLPGFRKDKYMRVLKELEDTHNIGLQVRYLFYKSTAKTYNDYCALNTFLASKNAPYKLSTPELYKRGSEWDTTRLRFYKIQN